MPDQKVLSFLAKLVMTDSTLVYPLSRLEEKAKKRFESEKKHQKKDRE